MMYQNEDLNDDFIRVLLGEEIDDNIFKDIYDHCSSSQDLSETDFDERLYLNILQDLKLEEDKTERHKNSAGFTITVRADLKEDVKNYSDIRCHKFAYVCFQLYYYKQGLDLISRAG